MGYQTQYQSKEVSVEDMFGMLHTGSNLLGVVEALDDVEWDSEWHQLGRLVHNVIGAVEEQVPQHCGDNLDMKMFFIIILVIIPLS